MAVRIIIMALLLATNVQAMGSKKAKPSSVEAWLALQRIDAINDMAPRIGLAPSVILKSSGEFKPCEHTGVNDDGPYVDGSKTACPEIRESVHAWCIPNPGGRVRYMFAIVGNSSDAGRDVRTWCVRHEVFHELLAHYGVGGHPLKVTVKRLDNGKSLTFKPSEIINGRWPSLVNVLIPEGMEDNAEWVDLKCGTDEIMRGDGEGI